MARTVLIVDDERHIEEVLAQLLEDEGYAVRRSYDGEAALQHGEEEPPDLVLSDVAMPRLGGIELAERLAARRLPVVLMSAAILGPRLSGVAFVPKPFDLDQILDEAEDLPERSSSR